VLIAQAVFLLERGHRQTNRQMRLNALPTSAAMPAWVKSEKGRKGVNDGDKDLKQTE